MFGNSIVKKKTMGSFKSLVSKKARTWQLKEVKDNLSVFTRNKYHLSKQVMPMKYALEKRFFAAAILLKLCELLLFGERKKNRVYFGLYKFSLDFQRREDQINFVHAR